MGVSDKKLLDENGLRLDGRKPDELRPISMKAGVLSRADGSCYLEWGLNKVMAGVYGPREVHPRHRQDPTRGLVTARYNMAPFSVGDRKRPGPDRRSQEISMITSNALENVVFIKDYPRTTVDVYIEVLQASAGTRCAGLTAASVALADAGIPMRDMVPSCAAGKIDDTVVLDLGKEEDNFGQADLPLAIVPRTGEVVLMQMDGHLTLEEFEKALQLAFNACKEINLIQKETLKARYMTEPKEHDEVVKDAINGTILEKEKAVGGQGAPPSQAPAPPAQPAQPAKPVQPVHPAPPAEPAPEPGAPSAESSGTALPADPSGTALPAEPSGTAPQAAPAKPADPAAPAEPAHPAPAKKAEEPKEVQ